jgi:plasmid stabilization system protein ParE
LRVRLSPRANDDLRSAVGYLLEKNPAAAVELKEQLLATIDRLAEGEFEGPEVRLRSRESSSKLARDAVSDLLPARCS